MFAELFKSEVGGWVGKLASEASQSGGEPCEPPTEALWGRVIIILPFKKIKDKEKKIKEERVYPQ